MLWSSFLQKQALSDSLPEIHPRSFNIVCFAEEGRVLSGRKRSWSDRNCSLGRVVLQQAGFPIMEALPSHQNFPPLHESLSSPYCYLKWGTKWINSQGDVKKIFCLGRVYLWEFAIQKLLIPSLQQNFKGNVTNLLNKP